MKQKKSSRRSAPVAGRGWGVSKSKKGKRAKRSKPVPVPAPVEDDAGGASGSDSDSEAGPPEGAQDVRFEMKALPFQHLPWKQVDVDVADTEFAEEGFFGLEVLDGACPRSHRTHS